MTALETPSEFYIIVTTDDPVITWNMSLGRIASAGAARASIEPDVYRQRADQWFPLIPNPEFQTAVSWQLSRVVADYRAEYHAERVRCAEFPNHPSRLACLYAWGSLDDVRRARKIGRRFRGTVKRCTLVAPALRIARCKAGVRHCQCLEADQGRHRDGELHRPSVRAPRVRRCCAPVERSPAGRPGVLGTHRLRRREQAGPHRQRRVRPAVHRSRLSTLVRPLRLARRFA